MPWGRLGVAEAPVRVRLSRAKGWRMPPNTVKVDRTTRWGNPFDFRHHSHCWTALAFGCRADPAGRRQASVIAYRLWLRGGKAVSDQATFGATNGERSLTVAESPEYSAPVPPAIATIRAELGGRNLACWCPLDAPCHADVLIELANAPEGAA